MNNNVIAIPCQLFQTEGQLCNILKTKNNHAANDEFFNLSFLDQTKYSYSAKELVTILGLNCSNDVERIAKDLKLKNPKYGKWIESNSLTNIRHQFCYNKVALTRMISYLNLMSDKAA